MLSRRSMISMLTFIMYRRMVAAMFLLLIILRRLFGLSLIRDLRLVLFIPAMMILLFWWRRRVIRNRRILRMTRLLNLVRMILLIRTIRRFRYWRMVMRLTLMRLRLKVARLDGWALFSCPNWTGNRTTLSYN